MKILELMCHFRQRERWKKMPTAKAKGLRIGNDETQCTSDDCGLQI